MAGSLFPDDAPNAIRQPKTDRLILTRYMREAVKLPEVARDKHAEEAHAILIKWADLESSGQLARMNENQLQGEFLADIFGRALGYRLFSEGEGEWSLEQHHTVGGQQPDAILGNFKAGQPRKPMAVIELKGPRAHLDRDRSNGRTAVQQCWEYLVNTERDCRWGIVSNMVSFRLYERDSTQRRYEHFSLQSLRDVNTFRQFYCLFHRKGLIEKTAGHAPRAAGLLEKSNTRQRQVGDELYDRYSQHRTLLIDHLHKEQGFSVPDAIEIVQRLLDRVIFIAFCEDRGLLQQHTIKRAYEQLPSFYAVTNPRWQNFKNLFRFLDKGKPELELPAYNGGLFAESPADDIELDDNWTEFFRTIGGYDFADEVNLDVLGHLFERSITELEKLRHTVMFEGGQEEVEQYAKMPQSVKRKRLGVYYTPEDLTRRIVRYTVDELITERLAALAEPLESVEYWQQAVATIRNLKIVDPACGSGAFLFQAYEVLEHRYMEAIGHLEALGDPAAAEHAQRMLEYILNDNLYGVDLLPEAVEIAQLALWIRSATSGRTLATLSHNIVHGNSLIHDPSLDPAGFDWKERFPEVFNRPEAGFDCVIGNPPWEKMKLEEREFFSLRAPEIATAAKAATRRQLVTKLEKTDPTLHQRYLEAKERASTMLEYCRKSGQYPLTGRGDINTYAVFTELASRIVSPNGHVGLLVPSGITSHFTTKDFFAALAEKDRLARVYNFDNRYREFFRDVHPDTQFCIFNFVGSEKRAGPTEYVFNIRRFEEIEQKWRYVQISGDDIKLLNPNTRTCPVFYTKRDAEITKAIYRRVPILIDESRTTTGNAWALSFKTMFHQT